jgi:ferredoxin
MKGSFNMSYFINDECISCGACETQCPVNAISSGEHKYIINSNICIECGACSDICPVCACKLKES